MNRVIEFYKTAHESVRNKMEEVAKSKEPFRLKRSQLRHLMFFNNHLETIKNAEAREFINNIKEGIKMGNWFKEVASLRGNDKAYSDNFNQIDWGNSDKTIETEFEIKDHACSTGDCGHTKQLECDITLKAIREEKEQKSFIQKYLKFWN